MRSDLLFLVAGDDIEDLQGTMKVFFPFPAGRFQGILRFVEKSFFFEIRSAVHGPLLAPSVSAGKGKRKSRRENLYL